MSPCAGFNTITSQHTHTILWAKQYQFSTLEQSVVASAIPPLKGRECVRVKDGVIFDCADGGWPAIDYLHLWR